VEDLLKWDKGLSDNKLISKESMEQIYTPNLNNYGYGWYIREDSKKNKLYEHSGVSGGYRSYIQRKPGDGTTIIMLSNFGDAPLEDMMLILDGYLSK
jgi:CubicO group peptidase (beta-lactamase class C family)